MERAQTALDAIARLDALTALPNRRAMTEELDAGMQRIAHSGRPFAAVLADIDHVKSITDRFGHHVGDDVLPDSASRLRAGVRLQGRVVRSGDGEFLLRPETHAQGAAVVAEYGRCLVADSPARTDDHALDVRMTLGMTQLAPGESMAEQLKRADAAPHLGKRGVRNRMEITRARRRTSRRTTDLGPRARSAKRSLRTRSLPVAPESP